MEQKSSAAAPLDSKAESTAANAHARAANPHRNRFTISQWQWFKSGAQRQRHSHLRSCGIVSPGKRAHSGQTDESATTRSRKGIKISIGGDADARQGSLWSPRPVAKRLVAPWRGLFHRASAPAPIPDHGATTRIESAQAALRKFSRAAGHPMEEWARGRRNESILRPLPVAVCGTSGTQLRNNASDISSKEARVRNTMRHHATHAAEKAPAFTGSGLLSAAAESSPYRNDRND